MKKNKQIFKSDWLYFQLLLSGFWFVISCQTLPKNIGIESRAFLVKWSDLSSPSLAQSITSYIYIKDTRFLRMDFVLPLKGTISRFVLNPAGMLVQIPSKKMYYKAEFNSQMFLPQFPAIPKAWIFALLKGQVPKGWTCSFPSKNKRRCKKATLMVEWIFKKSQWKEIYLTDSNKGKLKIRKLRRLNKRVTQDLFFLPLQGYSRQKTFSF